MAIKYVTSFSHTLLVALPLCSVCEKDFGRKKIVFFKIDKITVCIVFVNFFQMLVLNVLVMG